MPRIHIASAKSKENLSAAQQAMLRDLMAGRVHSLADSPWVCPRKRGSSVAVLFYEASASALRKSLNASCLLATSGLLFLGLATAAPAMGSTPGRTASIETNSPPNETFEQRKARYAREWDQRQRKIAADFAALKRKGEDAGDNIEAGWRDFLAGADRKWDQLGRAANDLRDASEEKWDSLQAELDEGANDFEKTLADARARWFPTRDEYLASAEARLGDFNDKLADFKERAEHVSDSLKDDAKASLDQLENKQKELANDLDRARDSAEGSWDASKAKLKDGLDEISRECEEWEKDFSG